MMRHISVLIAAPVMGLTLVSCGNGVPSTAYKAFGNAASKVSSAQNSLVVRYHVIALPAKFVPHAIMKDGQIPGSVGNSAAVYYRGNLKILGAYNGAPTFAQSVNASGRAVGYAQTSPYPVALEFNSGTMAVLTIPKCNSGGAQATSINDVGDVYGVCWTRGGIDSPFIARFNPSPHVVQATPDSTCVHNGSWVRGWLNDINSTGAFAYSSYLFASDIEHACDGTGSRSAPLPLNDPWSTAAWLNDNGTIVGAFSPSNTFYPEYAYEYSKAGGVKVIPSLPGSDDMEPSGINNADLIIGNAANSANSAYQHVFLSKGGVTYDITRKISPGVAVLLGLSDTGQFIAAGNGRYYLVSPADE